MIRISRDAPSFFWKVSLIFLPAVPSTFPTLFTLLLPTGIFHLHGCPLASEIIAYPMLRMMRPLKTLGILSISPVLQCSAYRSALLFFQQDLRPQCFAPSQSTNYAPTSSRRFTRLSSTTAPSTILSYRIGASFSAKGRRFSPKEDTFSFEPHQQNQSEEGHVTGKPNSGQDAFFASRIGNSNNVAFGVADGVGGWADSGIDSALFSHGLCSSMARGAATTAEGGENRVGPREILHKAYDGMIHDGEIDGGGSTACVAVGRDDGNFTVAK